MANGMSFEDYQTKYKKPALPAVATPNVGNISSKSNFDDLYKFMGAMTDKMVGIGEQRRKRKELVEDRTFSESQRRFNVTNPKELVQTQLDPMRENLASKQYEREQAPIKERLAAQPLVTQLKRGLAANQIVKDISPEWTDEGTLQNVAQATAGKGYLNSLFKSMRDYYPGGMTRRTALQKHALSESDVLPEDKQTALTEQLRLQNVEAQKRRRIEAISGTNRAVPLPPTQY